MIRETLDEYYTISSRIDAIDEEIRRLYVPTYGGNKDNIGAGRTSAPEPGNPTERAALRIVSLRARLEAERERLYQLAEEIEDWLETVEDPEIEAIIRWHYLLRCNWKTTNLKVYGYPDYDYCRKKIKRYFDKLSELSE